jgi:hypothetical protein
MFSPLRLGALIIASLLLTVSLSYLDSDTPSDNFIQSATFGLLVFGVITMLYASVYGLTRTLQRR